MQLRTHCYLQEFQFEGDITGIEIDQFRIISNAASLKTQFLTDGFIAWAGKRLLISYNLNQACAGRLIDLPPEQDRAGLFRLLQTQTTHLFKFTDSFATLLWFAKDNAVTPGTAYGFIEETSSYLDLTSDIMNCTADGKATRTTFSAEDLHEVVTIKEQIQKLGLSRQVSNKHFPEIPVGEPLRMRGNPEIEHYNDHNNIQRALLFLTNARKAKNIGFKIAMYVAMFECLFSVDKDEVKHKVCERVALYIGDDSQDRHKIYTQLSRAYDVRSKMLHGGQLKTEKKAIKNETLEEMSISIDQLLRRIMKKILMEDAAIFLQNPSLLNDYFKSLLFK